MKNIFDITEHAFEKNVSVRVDFEAPRGKALMVDSSDRDNGVLATGNLAGFLVRNVQSGGEELKDFVFPNRVEGPYHMGHECSVEMANAYEAEGSDHLLLSGTGALTADTAAGTLISYVDGKARVKQSNDIARFAVEAVLTEDADLADPDTNEFRVCFRRI